MSEATPDRPVYVHCEHGADRTGLLVALYRILYEGWSVRHAYEEWVRWGHSVTSRVVTGDLDIYFFNFLKLRAFPRIPARTCLIPKNTLSDASAWPVKSCVAILGGGRVDFVT